MAVIDTEELETFLVIDDAHLVALTSALLTERADLAAPQDAIHLLHEKYRGNSAATTALRTWLDEHRIPYRFTLV